ncbi:MAG: hypothetical protein J0H66_02145 [Solirubrobacterales bacterium]|nr:hypothetical protein [Solirubrobacterales bacterium]OJU95350.1 MAG: hypothetical protein BGO23_05730 [Solirubrobacterales bacterium 67-14]
MSIEWVDLSAPDRSGRLRYFSVPASGGVEAAASIRVDPAALGWDGLDGPLTLEPDEHGHVSPLDSRREVRLCRLLGPDGGLSPACTRSVLDRALGEAAGLGHEVIAAGEIECYLLDPEDRSPVYESIENYGIVAGAPYEGIMRQVRALGPAGVPVMASNPEYGGGQFEINLHHGPALAAMDAVALLRSYVGAIAARHGLLASFVAKPAPDLSGSGLHVHQSLWGPDGNMFWDGQGLSRAGRGYLAGLLNGIAELAPLGSSTTISYTRRTDGSFCPMNVSWGGDNRTLAVRVLDEDENATRIEQRDAAADANPYLVLAGQLKAGLDGMTGNLEPPPETEGNAYANRDLPPLPRTLPDALDLFRGSDLAISVLGEEAHSAYCAILEPEAEAFLSGRPAEPDRWGAW